ncbi:MAG TPA: alpha/beta hydrolase [Mycobacteriales bacterium]|jgi:pimeloyl-ACP methyl ester carboxylesterase|nr:alpha/beta hydrolase [Mycobacteriales bacterium]
MRILAALALTAGLVAGTAGVATAAPPGPDLAAGGVHAPVPTLAWTDCPGVGPGIQCATARVPLDYDAPAGPAIDVAVARHPATDRAHRVGSLFLNPGGPGGSGINFLPAALAAVDPSVAARFDLVGVDPRGTSRSTPVQCFATAAEQDAFFGALPDFPVGPEIPGWLASYRDYTSRCAHLAGPIIDHSSTANFVRDLDLLRQAVGDPGFSFLGYSYGSQVGSTYAAMFPSRVRAVVIDGVVDPVAWSTGYGRTGSLLPITTRLRSAEGASDTLGAFFRTCAAAGPDRCSFAEPGAGAAALAAKFDRVAAALRRHPVDLPQPGGVLHVTYSVLIGGALSLLYDVPSWPALADAAEGLAQATSGAAIPARTSTTALADQPVFASGFDAVACVDGVEPRSPLAWPAAALAQDRVAPYFGSAWTYPSQACATWPGHDTDRYAGPYDRPTARPVLVVGTRFDPATPYQAARTVAARLPGARLLTLDGYGHTSLAQSACIDRYQAAYLIRGALPPRGATCEPDHQPFDPTLTSSAARATVVADARP